MQGVRRIIGVTTTYLRLYYGFATAFLRGERWLFESKRGMATYLVFKGTDAAFDPVGEHPYK